MQIVDLLRRFLTWWGEALKGCVPGALRRFLAPPEPRLAIAVGDTRIDIVTERVRGRGRILRSIPRSGDEAEIVAEYLRSFRPRRSVPIGLRIPKAWCLERQLTIPYAARANAAAILASDLERSTPFRADEVLTAIRLGYVSPDRQQIDVLQLVALKSRVAPALSILTKAQKEARFIDAFDADPSQGLPVDLVAGGAASARSRGTSARATLLLLALLIGGTTLTTMHALARQEAAIARLDRMAGEARMEALAVRKQLDELEGRRQRLIALRHRKFGAPGTLAVLTEVTKLLPDSAWLESMRVSGRQTEITGLASSAADLVQTIEKSPLFENAQLSSAVMRDERMGAERFGLRFEVVSQSLATTEQGSTVEMP